MESLTTGTLAGTGSFRCEECGYVVTLAAADELPACPGCHGENFSRASLFAGGRFQRRVTDSPSAEERDAFVAAAREQLDAPGRYLAYEDAGARGSGHGVIDVRNTGRHGVLPVRGVRLCDQPRGR